MVVAPLQAKLEGGISRAKKRIAEEVLLSSAWQDVYRCCVRQHTVWEAPLPSVQPMAQPGRICYTKGCKEGFFCLSVWLCTSAGIWCAE